ncbi:testis-expressed protein 11-like [Rhincodon typus]|uniref:testis-expressed protein 11-like n=1 Tax=Rhincodon typus TaxID=259920 RepID=UPI00202E0FB4|nr:testis-expressed protein 11-like [Rhincodon typus]
MHLMQLLQRGKDVLAKQKIEDIIAGHYTGKRLASDILTQFHIVLWERATKNFEVQNYTEALQWYNYSLSFFSDGQLDQNLARLQRNRASCYLRLNQLEKNDQEDAARKAFEYLCEYSQDCSQLLTALRCLIRLVPSITNTDDQETRFGIQAHKGCEFAVHTQ